MGDGDDDQGDAQPGPGASSTSNATVRDAKQASVPHRRVRAGELCWEDFLYELKASLRAAASGGRPRAGNATIGAGTALTLPRRDLATYDPDEAIDRPRPEPP